MAPARPVNPTHVLLVGSKQKPERRRRAADPKASVHHLSPESVRAGGRSRRGSVWSYSSKFTLLFPGLLIQHRVL